MAALDCIFCQIIRDKIPSEIVFRDKKFIVFKDIHPKAEIHFLIVPVRHIESVDVLKKTDKALAGEMILLAQALAKKFKIQGRYKLVFNVGRGGGQLVEHIHLHLLSGWPRVGK